MLKVKEYKDNKTPSFILGYRILVDEWNCQHNKIMNADRFDKMLELYSSIRLHENEFGWEPEFKEEIESNKSRYELRKYEWK